MQQEQQQRVGRESSDPGCSVQGTARTRPSEHSAPLRIGYRSARPTSDNPAGAAESFDRGTDGARAPLPERRHGGGRGSSRSRRRRRAHGGSPIVGGPLVGRGARVHRPVVPRPARPEVVPCGTHRCSRLRAQQRFGDDRGSRPSCFRPLLRRARRVGARTASARRAAWLSRRAAHARSVDGRDRILPLPPPGAGHAQQDSVVAWLRLVATFSLVWFVPYALRTVSDVEFTLGALAVAATTEVGSAALENLAAGNVVDRLSGANGPNSTGMLAVVVLVLAIHGPVPRRRSLRYAMVVVGAVGLLMTRSLASTAAAVVVLGILRAPRHVPATGQLASRVCSHRRGSCSCSSSVSWSRPRPPTVEPAWGFRVRHTAQLSTGWCLPTRAYASLPSVPSPGSDGNARRTRSVHPR